MQVAISSLSRLACIALLAAASCSVVEANELRDQLVQDVADGVLDQFSLGQAALVAGRELDADSFQASSIRLNALVAKAVAETEHANNKERPAALFRYMHENILVGEYRSGQNDLNRLLQRGDYNCVTATILYRMMCDTAGVHSQAIAAPAHVFCRLTGEDASYAPLGDVETTCPTWYDQPLTRTAPRSGRPISDRQLVGKIFYNRGVYLLEMERFSLALQHLRWSLQFDADDTTAHTNRLAAFNNWALAETQAGRYESAVELLRSGMEIDPGYGPFKANDLHIHQKWVRSLCRQRREAEALQILMKRAEDRPNEPLYRDGPVAIYRHWLQRLVRESSLDRELPQVVDARRRISSPTTLAQEEARVLGPQRAQRLSEYASFNLAD